MPMSNKVINPEDVIVATDLTFKLSPERTLEHLYHARKLNSVGLGGINYMLKKTSDNKYIMIFFVEHLGQKNIEIASTEISHDEFIGLTTKEAESRSKDYKILKSYVSTIKSEWIGIFPRDYPIAQHHLICFKNLKFEQIINSFNGGDILNCNNTALEGYRVYPYHVNPIAYSELVSIENGYVKLATDCDKGTIIGIAKDTLNPGDPIKVTLGDSGRPLFEVYQTSYNKYDMIEKSIQKITETKKKNIINIGSLDEAREKLLRREE